MAANLTPRQKARRKRSDAKNHKAPKGKHWCHMHNDGEGAYLPRELFHKNKAKMHGLNDRCKACAKEYRKKYEKKNGERNRLTKTLRVPKELHARIKYEAARRDITIEQLVRAAIRFYFEYGCKVRGCSNPATPMGACKNHLVLRGIVDA